MSRMMSTDEQGLQIDGAGNLLFVDDLEALKQKVTRKLRLFQGEFFLNTADGVPYYQTIFTRPTDPGLASSIITKEIQDEPEVTAVNDINNDFDVATREFSYSATIASIYGEFEVRI